MITFIFILLMIAVFGKLSWFALKATWGITKVLFTIVFLPVILIAMALSGLVTLALVVLIIGVLASIISSTVV